MEHKEITRKQLYDLVWSIPMVTLSKQFNVKSTYLKKSCIDFIIPTPLMDFARFYIEISIMMYLQTNISIALSKTELSNSLR